MATATKRVHAATSLAHAAGAVSEAASLAFRTYQDNGGSYHWELVDSSGETLVQSGSFASRVEAERAARYVQKGAGSARFEPHVANERQTLAV
jgi:uncharacterized protein YegP (UPF0339 family)